jgi:hypothetical protein
MHKKDNKEGQLISINDFEFATVIINYCSSLHVFMTTSITKDPHTFLLNVTDNASALSWTNHTCRKSKLGRLLARFFWQASSMILLFNPYQFTFGDQLPVD